MSLRDLVEADCGGANPLMRMGNHFTRDIAYRDDGIANVADTPLAGPHPEMAIGPPQTFKMDALLSEMREMDRQNNQQPINRAPPVIAEVIRNSNVFDNDLTFRAAAQRNIDLGSSDDAWSMQPMRFRKPQPMPMAMPMLQNVTPQLTTNDFFQQTSGNEIQEAAKSLLDNVQQTDDQQQYSEFYRFMANVSDGRTQLDGQIASNQNHVNTTMDWLDQSANNAAPVDDYNQTFWQRLQDEWTNLSRDEEAAHPWLSEFADYHDYKEYRFAENNPMADMDNVLEKGKQFLANGDIPSAVICFEAAVKQDSQNAEAWQLLGTTQAENENDPCAISALKKAIELNPNNPQVLMALGYSYTNESLQSHALRTLVDWLRINPKYNHLVPPNFMPDEYEGAAAVTSSFVRSPQLREVEEIFKQAVQLNPQAVDPEVYEALGMMYNLTSEYDKAVECYQAGVALQPGNAKMWNRLGASCANGNRTEEAVDAYKKALVIEPGFIRARYNVGIICINLKSYDEAVEQFLSALNYQSSTSSRSVNGASGGVSGAPAHMSDSIWSTLRIAISLLGRHDLQVHIDNKDLHALNMAFGISEQ